MREVGSEPRGGRAVFRGPDWRLSRIGGDRATRWPFLWRRRTYSRTGSVSPRRPRAGWHRPVGHSVRKNTGHRWPRRFCGWRLEAERRGDLTGQVGRHTGPGRRNCSGRHSRYVPGRALWHSDEAGRNIPKLFPFLYSHS